MIWTAAFWKGASERAIKTLAQSLLAAFVVGVSILDIDVKAAFAIAATAVVVSFLTSIGSADFVSRDSRPEV